MLIKKDGEVINLININRFYVARIEGFDIKFEFVNGWSILKFETAEERDKAFDWIIDAYRWQRQVCDLD